MLNFFPDCIILKNFWLQQKMISWEIFVQVPFTMGVSIKPGHIVIVLILCRCSVGRRESKIILIAIFELA